MLVVVDDDIESPNKMFQSYLNLIYSCECFCITLLTPHGGRHVASCDVIWAPPECTTTSEPI